MQKQFNIQIMLRRLTLASILMSGLTVGLFGTARPVRAAGWIVNTLTDAANGSCASTCTLRDAISLAASGDTITFSVSGTITLTGTLIISTNVTINGPGASSLAIDGNNAVTVFTVNSGITASISGLTIQHGNSGFHGAGINNSGTLTITNSALSGNVSADIVSSGTGGAIYNTGTLMVSNSTLSGNSVTGGTFSVGPSFGNYPGYGGGIYNFGTLTVNNSTLSGNSASAGDTCFIVCNSIPSNGGGIYNSGTLTVSNSTLSGNSASDGGGIYNNATLNLFSDTIAKNTATDAGPDINSSSSISLGNNLIGDGTNSSITGATGDQIGTSSSPIDPLLGVLTSNGGPTQTMTVPVHSPAYQAGNCSGNATVNPPAPAVSQDQRGQNRKVNCDIGAFEETFTFAPNPLPKAIVGTSYSQNIVVSGGTAPYSFTVMGTLPHGLSLNGAGLLSGTPAQTGIFAFTVIATDANGLVGNIYYTFSVGALDTIGIFRSGTFYLRLHNTTGFADISVAFNPASKPYPVVGDWAGGGFDTVGVFNQNNGQFSLRNSNTAGTPDEQFVLGNANDIPLSGRWLISATHFGVGVFRPSNGLIYLKNNLTTGYADDTMVLGIPGDKGLSGDWTGKGFDSPGVYRSANQHFYLSDQVCNCSVIADHQLQYGVSGDAPVIGDWIAQGHDGVGLFRQSNGFTYLRNTLTTGYADIAFTYGIAGDVPLAGHWQLTYPPKPSLGSVLVPPTAAPVPTGNPFNNGLGD